MRKIKGLVVIAMIFTMCFAYAIKATAFSGLTIDEEAIVVGGGTDSCTASKANGVEGTLKYQVISLLGREIDDTRFPDESNNISTPFYAAQMYFINVRNNGQTPDQSLVSYYESIIPAPNESNWNDIPESGEVYSRDYITRTDEGFEEFVVWFKVGDGANAKYNYRVMVGYKKSPTDQGEGSEENQGNESNIKFTITDPDGGDFSKGNKTFAANLKIEGLDQDEDNGYMIIAGHSTDLSSADYVCKVENNMAPITEVVEENGDIYVWLVKATPVFISSIGSVNDVSSDLIIVSAKKVERPTYPDLSKRLRYEGLTAEAMGVAVNVPRTFVMGSQDAYIDRKISVKLGKVTENSILRKIKNGDKTGYDDLLKYAKSDSGISTGSMTSNDVASVSNQVPMSSYVLENGCYYYAYIVLEDENGKYYPVEDVSLLYGSIKMFKMLFNVDEEGFQWNIPDDPGNGGGNGGGSGSGNNNNGQANTIIPRTGNSTAVVFAVGIIVFVAIVGVTRYKITKM